MYEKILMKVNDECTVDQKIFLECNPFRPDFISLDENIIFYWIFLSEKHVFFIFSENTS